MNEVVKTTDTARSPEPKPSKNGWQIVTIVVPLVFAAAGAVWIYLDPDSRLFVAGIGVSLIFGFSLSSLGRIIEASKKGAREAEVTAASFSAIHSKLDKIAYQSAVSQSLSDKSAVSQSLSGDRLLTNVNRLLNGLSLTAEMKTRYPAISSFCEWKISQVEEYVHELVKQAEDGKVVIDDPARELTSSIELLRASASKEVLAISYEDTPFWTSNEGSRFLEEHKNAIARKVEITRVFIVKSDDENELLPIMKAQAELGVTVYKVTLNDVHDLNPSDLVIYDRRLVRMGFNEDHTKRNKFKAAQLIVSQENIRKQILTFQALLARSEKFEKISGRTNRTRRRKRMWTRAGR